FGGRVHERRLLVREGVLVGAGPLRRVLEREGVLLVALVADLAGEEEVLPRVREPVVPRAPERVLGALAKAGLGPEVLDVSIGDVRHLGLAERALVVLGPAELLLHLRVSVHIAIERERLRAGLVRLRIAQVRAAGGPAKLGPAGAQHRRYGRGPIDLDHRFALPALFKRAAARITTSIASRCCAVSPEGTRASSASIFASSALSLAVRRVFPRIASRRWRSSSCCGSRALGSPKRSLVRI